jgi:hypothetical protein
MRSALSTHDRAGFINPPSLYMTDIIPILAVNLPTYVSPAIALIAGILILMRPALLATIVAVYLIIVGVLGLLG